MRDLDGNAFLRLAEQDHTAGARHIDQLLPHILGDMPQLRQAEIIRGQRVDDPVGVAELVVEIRPGSVSGNCARMSPTFLRTW